MKRALVFANGEPNDGPMVRRALAARDEAMIVAVDGGVRVVDAFGLSIDMLIGDMDSISAARLAQLEAQGVPMQRHPVDKDATDLELALKWTVHQGADWVRIIGGVGGRFDQVLANVYLMGLPELRACDVEIVAARQAIRLLQPGEHVLRGQAGDTVSLIPVGGPVEGITTSCLRYPLNDEPLRFGPARGISNVMSSDTAHITTREGLLLVVHFVGQPD